MSDLTETISGLSSDELKHLHLLEASAGTGKTYSIQSLYLRLILIEGLTVQQVLVVTFTRDATKELRDRLQKVLREALETDSGYDDRTGKILKAAREKGLKENEIRQRLEAALLDFDMAAIFTIHAFCQQMLHRFAFETGQPFGMTSVEDTEDEIALLCKDWWRKHLYRLSPAMAELICEDGGFTLEKFISVTGKMIAKPEAEWKQLEAAPDPENLETHIKEKIRAFINDEERKTLEEGTLFPDALPEVQEAVKELQGHMSSVRENVAANKWDLALASLKALVNYRREFDIDSQKPLFDVLESAETFMKEVPKGTRVNSFTFDGQILQSPNCPGLAEGHTRAVRDAVVSLNFSLLEQNYGPFLEIDISTNGRRGLPVLNEHFCDSIEKEPPELFKAIKNIGNRQKKQNNINAFINCKSVNPGFSELYDELCRETFLGLLTVAKEIYEEYTDSRDSATSSSYDDLLTNLHTALLKDEQAGKSTLVDILRTEYPAALIDEFQDTDPVQWNIFKCLFHQTGIPCFLVGDPKQAIYRFRNGDIESYLKAKKNVERTFPLDTNYRSETRLIDAVNQIFLDSENQQTFGNGIDYASPLKAAGKAPEKSLLINGAPDKRPFQILLVPGSSQGSLPGVSSGIAMQVYSGVARQIAATLQDKTITLADQRLRNRDIAVLVNEHTQAEYIARKLRALGIPSVRQGTGDVWQTDEARTLVVIMEAILNSGNPSSVYRALLSDWCGVSADQILQLREGQRISVTIGGSTEERGNEDWVALFRTLRETWEKRGLPAMFRSLLGRLQLKPTLLAKSDGTGQRCLANLTHLEEQLQTTLLEEHFTPEGLLNWAGRQFNKDTMDWNDSRKLRLETDDDAVRILTVFISKGLEFPIVFAPTLFMMKPKQRGNFHEFHDDDGQLQLHLKTGDSSGDKVPKENEEKEIKLEQTRQMYVALTRAAHRCVVVALDAGVKDGKKVKDKPKQYKMKGALGELLKLPLKVEQDGETSVFVDLNKVDDRFRNVDGADPAIQVLPFEDWGCAPLQNQKAEVTELVEPSSKPEIDLSKGHCSFSSLAPHAGGQSTILETSDETDRERRNRDGESAVQSPPEQASASNGIFTFPAGARTGTCWHEIFEELSFSANPEELTQVVQAKLGIHGFLKNEETQLERLEVTSSMVSTVLQAPLPRGQGASSLRLCDIRDQDRKAEWEFSFPTLSGKRTPELKAAIEAQEAYPDFSSALGDWNKAIPGGYLTGFIDLLFRDSNGRYYILDWKSNRRNGQASGFTQEGLREEMSLHRYWLQYLIYTVALHQYLKDTLEGYRYEQHFGGVYYVFLRGVDGETDTDGHTNGVYADRPPEKLIEQLSDILGDFS